MVGTSDSVPMVETPVDMAEEFVTVIKAEDELKSVAEMRDDKVPEPLGAESVSEADSPGREIRVDAVLDPDCLDLEIVTVMFSILVVVVVMDCIPVEDWVCPIDVTKPDIDPFPEKDADELTDCVCSVKDAESSEEAPVAVTLDSKPVVRLETSEMLEVSSLPVPIPVFELPVDSVVKIKTEDDV